MGCFFYEWPKFKRAALVVAAAVALYAISRLVSREPRRKETHNGGPGGCTKGHFLGEDDVGAEVGELGNQ